MTLPAKVVEKDHRLDATTTAAQEQLAALRWHWTLDESNPGRVSFREYGKAVGRGGQTIFAMAKGYSEWSVPEIGNTRSLTDCIELAKLGADKQAATEALAKATGKSISNVASAHRSEVRSVMLDATEAAERRGTTVAEEIPRVAKSRAQTQALEAKTAAERRARYGLRYTQIEGDIAAAKRRLNNALQLSADIIDEEERDLLRESIANLSALLRLIDLRLGGTVDIDWDAEHKVGRDVMTRDEASAWRTAVRDELFDHLVDNKEGLTVDEIMTKLDCSYGHTKRAIRDLRLFLGEFDSVNLPCTPRGQGERWVYSLTTGGGGDETREWSANRVGDGETRLRTIRAVMASEVSGTDGRTVSGKRARRIERGLRHMIEDLDALILDE